MEVNVGTIITAVTGSVISAALVAIAVGLNRLNVQVALLNSQFQRVEKDIQEMKDTLSTVYDEHRRCRNCNPDDRR